MKGGDDSRSSLETKVAAELDAQGIEYQFESYRVEYFKDPATYLPDFILPNGIIIETKGHFESKDRAKHLLIKEQHPNLDVRFIFSDSSTKLTGQKYKEFAKWLNETHSIKVTWNRIPPGVVDKYREEFWATLKAKPSQTTYADWCTKHHFQFADLTIPQDWLKEPPEVNRMAALEALHPVTKKASK